jgi:ferric-dicitrate binding protein FerR (iron transport regulator)
MAVIGWASANLKIMYQFEKQFRLENPQTVGETDSHFDLDNYKDWLEQKLIASNVALNDLVFQVNQYASGDIITMDYFRDELKVAEKAFVSLG